MVDSFCSDLMIQKITAAKNADYRIFRAVAFWQKMNACPNEIVQAGIATQRCCSVNRCWYQKKHQICSLQRYGGPLQN